MKKLMTLLMAATLLLTMPVSPARAEGAAAVVSKPEAGTAAVAGAKKKAKATATPAPKKAKKKKAKATPTPTPAPEKKKKTKSKTSPTLEKSLAYWEETELPALKLKKSLRQNVLIIARSQVGYVADRYYFETNKAGKKRFYTRYGDWYGPKFCDWCDAFVSFCVSYAGNADYPLENSCTRHEYKLKAAGYWREWNSYVPKPGDLVFYCMASRKQLPDHVGLVEEVHLPEGDKAGYLVTIEGNLPNPKGGTATCVRRMVRSLESVVGYGVYEKGKIYPESNSVRFDGRKVIEEDSIYFVEKPTKAALRFLGLEGTAYWNYWFPEEAVETPPEPLPVHTTEESEQ